MGAADADKKDVVFECARQLLNIKTYLKFSEEDLKSIISDIQKYTQNGQWKVTCTKGTVRKKRQNFCCQKCIYSKFHIFI